MQLLENHALQKPHFKILQKPFVPFVKGVLRKLGGLGDAFVQFLLQEIEIAARNVGLSVPCANTPTRRTGTFSVRLRRAPIFRYRRSRSLSVGCRRFSPKAMSVPIMSRISSSITNSAEKSRLIRKCAPMTALTESVLCQLSRSRNQHVGEKKQSVSQIRLFHQRET